MRKYFITGIVILLPLALTIAILIFVFNLLTGPFIGIVKGTFEHLGLFEEGFLFLSSSQVQTVVAQILILIILFSFTVLLGMIARWFFFHSLLRFADFLLHRIPFVNSIYKTCQDIIKTIFAADTKSFKQVVLVPFPSKDIYSVGLITRDNIQGLENTAHINPVAVFVPTTPNPTSGFLMLFKQEDLVYLDMSVEDAFKYIISCGVIYSPFNAVSKADLETLTKPKTTESNP